MGDALIRALVAWGDALRLSLIVHQVLRASGRRDGSLVDDAARLRDPEGAARFN